MGIFNFIQGINSVYSTVSVDIRSRMQTSITFIQGSVKDTE
jgi:hypothetical protein